MSDKVKAAVVQMVSSNQVADNVRAMERLLEKAKQEGADWAVLPECWPLMGDSTDKLAIQETFKSGQIQTALADTARCLRMTIFAGSIFMVSEDKNRVYNSLLTFSPKGEICARYDKQHLFDYVGSKEWFCESNTIKAGTDVKLTSMIVGSFRVAQGICFDLRFPEFFYKQLPFDVLVLPAAFTYETGQSHWEILLRARAIEHQCYVLASAQGGWHNGKRRTFGHSMIIDPWGRVLAQIEEGAGVITAELDLALIRDIRHKLPVRSCSSTEILN